LWKEGGTRRGKKNNGPNEQDLSSLILCLQRLNIEINARGETKRLMRRWEIRKRGTEKTRRRKKGTSWDIFIGPGQTLNYSNTRKKKKIAPKRKNPRPEDTPKNKKGKIEKEEPFQRRRGERKGRGGPDIQFLRKKERLGRGVL